MPSASSILTRVLVLLWVVASLRAADTDALQDQFESANAKLDNREFQAAIELYNGILEQEPEADNVWIMRALAKWNLQDASGARADLAQALNLAPENSSAYRLRAQIRYQTGDHAGSLADADQAIDLAGDAADAELFGIRAQAQKTLGENDAAIEDLNRAIELNPDFTAAYYLRAQLYEEKTQAAAAEADYSRVIELAPRHVDALNQRAWLRFYAADWEAAITDSQRVLELAPQAAVAMRLIGYAHFGQGNYAEAAQMLSAAADADPGRGAAYALFIRHHALLRAGAPDDRLASAWAAWTDDPWAQALARFLTGEIDEERLDAIAHEVIDEVDRAGRLCEMHFYIGLMRLHTGDRSTAKLRFQTALSIGQKTFIEDTLSTAELNRL